MSQSRNLTEKDLALQAKLLDAEKEKMLGNLEKAAQLLTEILEQSPQNATVHFELGRLYYAMQDQERAIEEIQTAADLEPGNEWFKLQLAEILFTSSDYEDAGRLYSAVHDLRPKEYHFMDQWIQCLIKDNNLADAITVLDKKKALAGVIEEDVRLKYDLLMRLGKTSDALSELEDLLFLSYGMEDYLHLVAHHHQTTGDQKSARETFLKILELNPEDPKANLALARDAPGKEADTYGSLRAIMTNPSIRIEDKIEQLRPHIDAIVDGGKSVDEELLTLAANFEAAHPDQPGVMNISGDLLSHEGRFEEALQKFRTVVRLQPGHLDVWIKALAISDGQYYSSALLELASDALDVFPNQALINYYYALANFRLYKLDEALGNVEQTMFMIGNQHDVKLRLLVLKGTIYVEKEDYSQALKVFDEIFTIDRTHLEAQAAFALALARQGEDLNQAEGLVNKVLSIDAKNAVALQANAIQYSLKGRHVEAQTAINYAISNSRNPALYDTMGDIYFRQGNLELAIENWERARSEGYSSPSLEKKITSRTLHK